MCCCVAGCHLVHDLNCCDGFLQGVIALRSWSCKHEHVRRLVAPNFPMQVPAGDTQPQPNPTCQPPTARAPLAPDSLHVQTSLPGWRRSRLVCGGKRRVPHEKGQHPASYTDTSSLLIHACVRTDSPSHTRQPPAPFYAINTQHPGSRYAYATSLAAQTTRCGYSGVASPPSANLPK